MTFTLKGCVSGLSWIGQWQSLSYTRKLDCILKLCKYLPGPKKGRKVAGHQEGTGTKTWASSEHICLILVSFCWLVFLLRNLYTHCVGHMWSSMQNNTPAATVVSPQLKTQSFLSGVEPLPAPPGWHLSAPWLPMSLVEPKLYNLGAGRWGGEGRGWTVVPGKGGRVEEADVGEGNGWGKSERE